MSYKYDRHIIVVKVIILYSFTTQHYVPPPDACLFSKICNHTGIPVCGTGKENFSRLFLDDCDLFEYNCDNQKDYSKVDTKYCLLNETVSTPIILSYIKPTTPHNFLIQNIFAKANQSARVNRAGTKSIQLSTPETTKVMENSSFSRNSTTSTCSCPIITCLLFNITDKLKGENTTILIVTEATTKSSPIDSTTTSIKVSTTTNVITSSVTTTNKTDVNATKTQMISTTCTTANPIKETTVSTLITTVLKNIITPSIRNTTKYKKNDSTILVNEELMPQITCDVYPKHCNRPHTWETTSKGEIRDFFQILRAQYGNDVKILKDATHYPREIPNKISKSDEGLQFGQQNET